MANLHSIATIKLRGKRLAHDTVCPLALRSGSLKLIAGGGIDGSSIVRDAFEMRCLQREAIDVEKPARSRRLVASTSVKWEIQ